MLALALWVASPFIGAVVYRRRANLARFRDMPWTVVQNSGSKARRSDVLAGSVDIDVVFQVVDDVMAKLRSDSRTNRHGEIRARR